MSYAEPSSEFKLTSRRIAIPGGATLDDLAAAILDAVEFDHDHLYRFEYQNRFGVEEHINHFFLEEKPWTCEVRVGDVPLGLDQAMTFLFDFGDWWEFDVTLERVDPELAIQEAEVLETRGAPPDQYGWKGIGDEWV
jgi:hypothetical protein